jgi:hypothetical protein
MYLHNPMKLFRLNRLFNAQSQRCFDVAIDHGFFNELGFLGGIENLPKAVETLVGANPEANRLTVGQAEVLQRIPGKQKPALVLRTDVANVYGRVLPRALFSRMIEQAVQQAIRLDATCVVVNLFQIPEQPEAPTNASRTSSDSSRSATGTRCRTELGFDVPFKTITGGIFEVGFPDVIQQMWAAFMMEREGALGSRFGCATPAEAVQSHRIFAAALTSQTRGETCSQEGLT